MTNPTIALFIHQPKCSIQSGNGIIQALGDHYKFKIFTKHSLEKDFFDNVDMVAFPGGTGDSESFDYLMSDHLGRIKDFVNKGGRYLGICMGAYWADHHYFDLLDEVEAQQYIRRPGTDTRRPHPKALAVNWQGQIEKMYFYDGCALVGNAEKFKTISSYANGDAMAIIQNRVGLIGCHPESEKNWYTEYHQWMRPHWHHRRHHRLLLDFVNQLMER